MLKHIVLALALALWTLSPARPAMAADSHAASGGAAAVEKTSGAHDDHAKPALIPDFSDRAVQLHALWVVIIFVVLLIILYPTAWKNVLAGLKAREARIRNDIAEAEAIRLKAEATLKEYNAQLASAEARMRELIAQGTAQGEKLAADIHAKAEKEAEQTKQRALQDIDAARKQAIHEIYRHAADLSTSIASKILRRSINPDDQRDLVQRSLDELQNV